MVPQGSRVSGTVVRPLLDWKAAGVTAPVSGWKSSGARPVTRKLASVVSGGGGAVVDEVEVGVGHGAMDEEHLGVGRGFGVGGVGLERERLHGGFDGIASHDTAFADLARGLRTGAPELGDELLELVLIVGERGIVDRRFAGDGCAPMDELRDAAKDGQAHVLRVRIEREHAVAHPGVGDEIAVIDLELVREDVSVDEVEVVALGQGGIVVGEDGGDVGIFTVVSRLCLRRSGPAAAGRSCARGNRSRAWLARPSTRCD